MDWPSVSVVVPSLNRGRFLERTLLSILRQDYPGAVQVIVADGGSTDETVDILRKYPRVTWWSEPDGGMADAMTRGLAAASGDVLAVQACDDFYLEDAFRACVGELAADPALDVAAGCDVYLRDDGRTFSCSALDAHEITPRSLMMRRVIPIHAAFFRRRVWEKVGLRALGDARSDAAGNVGNVGVDIDFWYRALHFFAARFVPRHAAAYQLHAGQMTGNSRHWYENLTRIVESCERDPAYAGVHAFSGDEKENLYIRWRIQQARFDGDEPAVARLVRQVMAGNRRDGGRYTRQTRDFLRLHGFAPKLPKPAGGPVHPNHKVPDFAWMYSTERDQPQSRGALRAA